MVYLIHGDDIIESRKKLEELTQNSPWVIRLDGKNNNLSEVLNAIEAQELFNDKKTIVIENVLGFGGESIKKLIEIINKNQLDGTDILIWHNDNLTAAQVKWFKNAKPLVFSLPKLYYKFLDSITLGNCEAVRRLLYNIYPQIAAEQIFYSIIKRVRILLIIKTGILEEFEDTKKMAPWQIGILKKQASGWQKDKLVDFYQKLFDIEMRLKTSQLPMSLINHIDILLLQELK
ncbi:hypothetical protein C4577_04080 [Candidatus Parcubacteria bacterium]|nr:MAG: hypothetical protein C4577_04080 [Candidatus Parcubacteria bacterium]